MNINITYDRKINVAIGRSRREVSWKNRELLWSDFVKRLSENHRTAETFAEYIAAKKNRRDEIKDIGAFVGGYLAGGRRKAGNVQDRSLLTLDADFPPSELWSIFMMMVGSAAVMYSTHSHSSEKPRFRLVILLSRDILPDEYEPIARKVAELIGINYFDDTTYQPERLMYWWSTAKDGDAVFEYNDAEALDPDKILGMYRNWRDASEWPVSARQHDIIKRELKKQESPVDKPGVIGAFCRSYNIHEAIEHFLADYYEESAVPGRYTYKNGSTAAGLVTYDDVFAYSHHGTDPSSGKLCNAFDLVRLHLFGLKDEDSSAKGNALPSYQAMIDLAVSDPGVRKLLAAEKLQSAKADFAGVDGISEEDMAWMADLETDRKGNPYKTVDNILLILKNSAQLKDNFAYDEFQKTEVATRDLPWRKVNWYSRRVEAIDEARIRRHLERPWGISAKDKTDDAFLILTQDNKVHPVKSFLEETKWDGKGRLDTLFIDFMGVEDSEYTRAVTRKTLVAAVTRIYEPGCKFDYMLVFAGKQGTKKSSLIRLLGRDWVNESFNFSQLQFGGKEASEQIQGYWIIEAPEMAGFDRADMNQVKNFIARRVDSYRVAYGRRTQEFPRQCIFISNSNNHEFLTDITGNRRYWVLPIYENEPTKSVDTDCTDAYVRQVWAEALYRYRKGEELYLPEALEETAKAIQSDYTQEHPWKAEIEAYLGTLLPDNWWSMDKDQRYQFINYPDDTQAKGVLLRDRVCLQELWVEGLQQRMSKKMNRTDAGILSDIMNNLEGWGRAKSQRYGAYGVQRRGWLRVENSIDMLKKLEGKNDAKTDF